jgi:G:T-mismatch repair DNA endonuclease (very short patch repair protein)
MRRAGTRCARTDSRNSHELRDGLVGGQVLVGIELHGDPKFWRNKIETNKRRDRRVSQSLRRDGWVVVRVKECAVRKPSTLARIRAAVSDMIIAPGHRAQFVSVAAQ